MPRVKDRRRAQAGTTLIELLVSLMIVGIALVLIVGTFSTGLLDATLAKRNTAAQAIVQYEMDKIAASAFSTSALDYSDCFATDNPSSPAPASGYLGSCTGGGYSIRADVEQPSPSSGSLQVWTVTTTSLSDGLRIGTPISIYKADR